ncbi:MAG: DUF169 domain-containing protein [Ignavibacteria bacterium]|jgi:uncharacterized protein (DUF169 family)
MNKELISTFIEKWKKYFNNAELPIVFYYSNSVNDSELLPPAPKRRCMINELTMVRDGRSLCYAAESFGCEGGKRYTGFSSTLRPNFEYFLSCGIEGEMEGERYKRTPEIVQEILKDHKQLDLPGKYLIFKRWDKLSETDHPDAVIFFAKSDVLAGLFTLASFDEAEPNTSFTPFGAGCSSIVYYPYLEKDKEEQRAVIGMFDPSARVSVGPDEITFTVPMKKFEKMVGYMDESFLITPTWKKIQERIS